LRITDTVSGYEKRAVRNGQLLSVVPLDFPPLVFETEGLWFQISPVAWKTIEEEKMHCMGSIHALEHALIALLPLLVMSDRNDFGGISTPMHAQTGRPTVFVYDAFPGGAGLTRTAFFQAREMFAYVYKLIADCSCEFGCPSCVHSPKCGSGNRPIDKEGAARLLEYMLDDTAHSRDEAGRILAAPPCDLEEPANNAVPGELLPARRMRRVEAERELESGAEKTGRPSDFVVLDVETRRSAAEVGGWHRADHMGVSVAVLYDSRSGAFSAYRQEDVPELAAVLAASPLVVGFNIQRFDYAVLQPHAPGFNFRALPTCDMLIAVHERLSYRLSLDNLSRATLGGNKSADGLQALRWWKEQRLSELEEYCRQDVALTRDLYLFGREHGYLLFTNKAGSAVRVSISW
jgi:DEAD/DEAH box helicase domain-containing protein